MTIGDTVTLKSGGPAMTVAALLGNVTAAPVKGAYVSGPAALCEWFEGETLQRRVWPIDCLRLTPMRIEVQNANGEWQDTRSIEVTPDTDGRKVYVAGIDGPVIAGSLISARSAAGCRRGV